MTGYSDAPINPAERLLSIVVPVYNEAGSVVETHRSLTQVMAETGRPYELIFVNDGSSDASITHLEELAITDPKVRVLDFSRNFGKEIALTAGMRSAVGDGVLTLDADGQHPPHQIPRFLKAWDEGAEVVVGVRRGGSGQTPLKRLSSRLYYRVLNGMAETKVVPNSTDFRLVDRSVVDEFNRFTERNRITRGLVDWLGFRRDYVYFDAEMRAQGSATYSFRKLIRLALDSFVSTSLFPLKVAGYLGAMITLVAAVATVIVLGDKYILNDPLHMSFTGASLIALFVVFLVGIILSCLGLIALYIANIHIEVVNRPLYVLRPSNTSGPQLSRGQPSSAPKRSERSALRR